MCNAFVVQTQVHRYLDITAPNLTTLDLLYSTLDNYSEMLGVATYFIYSLHTKKILKMYNFTI